MKPNAVCVILFLLGSQLAQADAPLYKLRIASTKTFEVVAGSTDTFSLYPLSQQMRSAMNPAKGRNVIAADYETGLRIRTKNPAMALQEILNQIARQTGLMLRQHLNTSLAQIAPSVLLQGFSDTSVITLLLTPKEEQVFMLTCAFVIDARPNDSIDGTPTSMAQMEETSRRMNADSVATNLPTKIVATELKPEDYFRGAQKLSLSDPAGKKQTPVLVLLLKKRDDYTIGIYRDVDGTWVLLDQPVTLSGTGSPHPRVKSDAGETLSSIRVLKLDGAGGIDFYVNNGHILQQAFSN